ncbi:phytanoyl-CoA dioxygenase family protein [Rhizorhabdus dicambivorans]|uniref:Phytanoyl-CoA dioxygenase n=1 Tax=Rhizorhabdus dicambivorans TaxID=1850238 RepID=A0A2A4G1N4_9SPHN|nr:phytanoyl-CoA dioxygenase family protein [Rhizorhabdus dicambivorans]ATE66604.1 phytanoyl-CoA dioxygenase [Rhizorhabdus dicambivorans]PCE43913.1 phytanoyl-CoA dioxygenase [Rhizorhabdus dicambivorans]
MRGRILRNLLAPWWAAQLLTGAKSFLDNPLIGSDRLNRRGLHAGRVELTYRLAEKRRARLGAALEPADLADFRRDGFVVKRDFLPPETFAALRDQLLGWTGPAREMVQGDTITRRYAVDPAMLRDVPAMRAFARDPRWQALARYVASFDVEPLLYVQSILSHRREAPADPQTALHADTFHPTMKAWLFLQDVGPEDGPLTYVPGSHRLTAERIAWERRRSLAVRDSGDFLSARGSFRVEPEELAGLGLPQATAFAVPANTLVVADTFGFHARALSRLPTTRIELFAYSRRNPFLPFAGLDPWSLPGIAERRIPLLWLTHDIYRRWIGQPWARAGRKRPGDE